MVGKIIDITPIIRQLLVLTEKVYNWFGLGMYLRVNKIDLQKIKKRNPKDFQRAKIELFQKWINNNLDVSWKTFARGLESIGNLYEASVINNAIKAGMLSP